MSTRRPDERSLQSRPDPSGKASVDRFLTEAAKAQTPSVRSTHRLLFGIDATASRQPTWDLACELHAELFAEAARAGNLAIQLCYYRGLNEFVASQWATTPSQLREQMISVSCRGGRTQMRRLLEHALSEASRYPVRALVFIGDCFEEDEADVLRFVGQLAIRALPVFIFQEGADRTATRVFKSIARLTNGAHIPFDSSSPDQLRRLLGAIAQYAAGGRSALDEYARRIGGSEARALLSQLKAP
jgi:hypothetical protein